MPFVVGLALSRLDLSDARVLRRLTLWGGVAALAAFLVASLSYAMLGPAADSGWLRLLTGAAHGQMPLWLVSATGNATFLVAVCILVGRLAAHLVRWLAALGTYALTIYVAHVLLLAVVKPPEGLPSFPLGALISTVMIGTFLTASLMWHRTGLPGPLEWVLRHPWLRPAPHAARAAATPEQAR